MKSGQHTTIIQESHLHRRSPSQVKPGATVCVNYSDVLGGHHQCHLHPLLQKFLLPLVQQQPPELQLASVQELLPAQSPS